MSVYDAATGGDRLKTLEALRDTISDRIDGSESARDVAALSGQLTQVLKQIEDLARKSGEHSSKVDELAAKRQRRQKPIRDGVVREG